MVEKLLETKRTTPSAIDFTRALLVMMPGATKEQVGVLWSHFAGETGSGQYCWNWNLGNVKHVAGDGYDYVSLRGVWEGFTIKDEDGDGDIDADDRTILVERLIRSGMWQFDPSADHAKAVGPRKVSMLTTVNNPAAWFRAYPSLEVGMQRYVDQKRNPNGRYFSAWQFVLSGEPELFGRELGKKGYYTASQDAYAASMRRQFDLWMKSTAYEQVMQDDRPTPSVNLVSDPIVILESVTDDGLIPVELDGVTWLVYPMQIGPIAIGRALEVVQGMGAGFELPSPALTDAIWREADMKIPPHLMIQKHDGVHMNTDAMKVATKEAIEKYIADRPHRLTAGAFKDVVMVNGKLGIYGWHCAPGEEAQLKKQWGVPLYPCATPGLGKVVQSANTTSHSVAYEDYSQGFRPVRRA